MEESESMKETRLEKLKKARECLKVLCEERDRRKAIMFKRHALFTSLISDSESLDDFYKEYSELLELLGIDMYFMKRRHSGEKCLALWIQLDYTEYEEYFIYEKNGKLRVSGTVSWQNEVCANEDWDIKPDDNEEEEEDDEEDEEDEEEEMGNYWERDEDKNEELGYEPYW